MKNKKIFIIVFFLCLIALVGYVLAKTINVGEQSGDIIYIPGKLGIQTTAPAFSLDVVGDVKWSGTLKGGGVPWANLTNFPSACPSGQYMTGVGTTLICASLPSSGLSGSGTSNYLTKWTGSSTLGNSQIYDNGTNVGIGITTPGTKLDIYNTADEILRLTRSGASYPTKFRVGTDSGFVLNVGNSDIFVIKSNNVGIGTTVPGTKLEVSGDIRGSNIYVSTFYDKDNSNFYVDPNGTSIFNKVQASVIDPVYEIEGKKYVTYVSDFAGGLKVETSGLIKLLKQNQNLYQNIPNAIIDFEKLEKESDLWIFWQVSNKNIENLVVLLTPSFDGKVWYKKDKDKLIIFGEKEGEVSFRLLLPRYDSEYWPNILK